MRLLFTTAILLSAFLLFLTQPLYGKMVLPLLGGAPAVWNTAMFFFQACLLAGYAYAHFSLKWLGLKRQAVLHCLLLAAAALFLPLTIPAGWTPSPEGNPSLAVLEVLARGVGVPFFMLAASAPLLQRWFSLTGHPLRDNPYFLYAASNAGSMAALLAFPILFEPLLTTPQTSIIWAGIYAALIAAFILCAIVTVHRRTAEDIRAPQAASEDTAITWKQRAAWTGYAFIPSALLLAVTNHLTADVAAVPLLWVIPLALYLLTFIIVFSRIGARLPMLALSIVFTVLTVAAAIMVLFNISIIGGSLLLTIGLHLAYLFTACLLGHARLMQSRPAAERLTEYYLWMSFGGMLGGMWGRCWRRKCSIPFWNIPFYWLWRR